MLVVIKSVYKVHGNPH